MSVRRFPCFLLFALVLTACGGTVNPTGPADPDMSLSGRRAMEKELDGHLKRWTSHRPDDYDYKINKICFCEYPVLYPVTVEVRNGERRRAISDDEQVVGEDVPLLSVEDMFELTRAAIQSSSRVVIYYDQTYGFPNRVSIGKWPDNVVEENTAWTLEVME